MGWIGKLKKKDTRILISSLGFPSSTAFQLLLVETFANNVPVMKSRIPPIHYHLTTPERGVHYVMITSILSTLLFWLISYK